VHLRQLSLTNFRNYAKQEFELEPGTILLLGANAQGKTNVLESIFLLAAGRSERAEGDADFIAWAAREDPQPHARVVAHAARAGGDVTVELTLLGREGARGHLVASKRIKLNGVAKRAADIAGAILAVLFTTDDMELVRGAPAGRRRYLDVMLSQAGRAYGLALRRYNKVVAQRNALLKRIQRGEADADELAFWDEELARDGAVLLVERARAVEALNGAAADLHARLSGGAGERFDLAYHPRLGDGWPPERIAASDPAAVAAALLARLQAGRQRDIAAGMTLAGPHRDDLTMMLDGEPAAAFASRGQQRTVALALRLAEARLLFERSGERPLLLLDDVLSELDEERRAAVLAAIDADQAFITSADADRFGPEFAARAQVFCVKDGVVTRRSGA
jgi:DNA replication and repair protein RecF